MKILAFVRLEFERRTVQRGGRGIDLSCTDGEKLSVLPRVAGMHDIRCV